MTPQWTNGTDYCIDKGVCDCHGDRVTVHKQPLLFDITNDPAENTPIAADIPKYQEVMKHIYPAIKVHKESIEIVPNQLEVYKTFFFILVCKCVAILLSAAVKKLTGNLSIIPILNV